MKNIKQTLIILLLLLSGTIVYGAGTVIINYNTFQGGINDTELVTLTLSGEASGGDSSISSVKVNGKNAVGTGIWAIDVTLSGGLNTFNIVATDELGNTGSTTLQLNKKPIVSNITSSPSGVNYQILFNTDVSTIPYTDIGLSENNLNLTFSGTKAGTAHVMSIIGLVAGTQYFTQIYGSGGNKVSYNFETPAITTPAKLFVFPDKTNVATGAVGTSTGVKIEGIDFPAMITTDAGDIYKGTTKLGTYGTVKNGDIISIKLNAPNVTDKYSIANLTLGNCSNNNCLETTFKVFSKTTTGATSGTGTTGTGTTGTGTTTGSGDNKSPCDTILNSSGPTWAKCVPLTTSGTTTTTAGTVIINSGSQLSTSENEFEIIKNTKKNVPGVIKNTITDIDNSFAKDDISRLIQLKIVKGFSDGLFKPENNTTRAEFLAMAILGLKIELEDSTKTEFTDIPTEGSWMIKYINKAQGMGIVKGQTIDGKLKFRPNDPITRIEALAILIRLANIELPTSYDKSTFEDVTEEWMIKYANKAKELEIASGQELDGKLKFRPNDPITRAEVATILIKVMDIKELNY